MKAVCRAAVALVIVPLTLSSAHAALKCPPMDFDGDCRSDILWRHSATGENQLFLMNGHALAWQGPLDVLADRAWQVKGIGDFDGDGRADILWRHVVSGQNSVYLMNGSTIASQTSLSLLGDLAWHVKGIGDFDGDGKDDILWRNTRTGENYIALMNGATVLSQGAVNIVADQAWQIKGVGDFDGDGRADILWRHAATGANYMYLMNGLSIASQGSVNTLADQAWQVKGVADFDGDGRADILWRHAASGENYLYLMSGSTIASEGSLDIVSDLAWQVKGIGDFDGDGRTDILWRHSATGENRVYLMNGRTIVSQGPIDTIADLNWMPRSAPTLAETPYPRTPIVLPGTFEAENFDLGGEGVSYRDNGKGNAGGQYRTTEDVDIFVSDDPAGGGYIIKSFAAGEWLGYTISVPTSGSYDIELRAATSSAFPNSAYHIEVDGVNVTGTVVLPDTGGWTSYQWLGSRTVHLTAGTHFLKVVAEQPYFGLNRIRISNTTRPTPYLGTPVSVPAIIEAENFDLGGKGVAYHDNTPGNQGGQHRNNEDVDIFVSDDPAGGGYIIKNFEAGEWLGYTISVPTSGSYDIELRAATNSSFPNSAFHVEIDGVNVTGSVVLPDTGGWTSYQWVGKRSVQLAAGTHFLKVVSEQPYFGFNTIRVSATPDTTAPSTPTGLTVSAFTPISLTLAWSAATDNVGVTGYRLYRDGVQVADVAVTSYSNTGLSPASTYSYTVSAYDATGNESAKSAALSVNTPALTSAPFSGTPIAIPGTFEAENFDRDGEGFAYHDNVPGNQGGQYRTTEDVDIFVSDDPAGGGYIIKNFAAGEWLGYTISVPTSGSYDIELRAATSSAFPNSAYHIEVDGVNVTGTVVLPDTGGWTSYQWVGKRSVELAAGTHFLKVVSEQPYFGFNTIRVSATPTTTPSPSPDPITPPDFAEDFVGVSFPGGMGSYSSPNPPATWWVDQKTHGRISAVDAPGGVGGRAVSLHTEPGDNNACGGTCDRADLTLSLAGTRSGEPWQVALPAVAGVYEGSERWYAHSLYFPRGLYNPPAGTWDWAVYFDFHGIRASRPQPLQLDMHKAGGGFRFIGGGGPNGSYQWSKVIAPTPALDTWYDFVYHIRWSSKSDGFIHIWLNGKLLHRQDNQPTLWSFDGTTDLAFLKLANYHNATGVPSTVIHRRIRIGKTPESVSAGPLEGVLMP